MSRGGRSGTPAPPEGAPRGAQAEAREAAQPVATSTRWSSPDRRLALGAVGVFLAVRAATAVAFAVVAALSDLPQDTAYRAWDAFHFLNIADQGYPRELETDPSRKVGPSEIAFFPGFPLAVAGLSWLLPEVLAALTVAVLSGAVAAAAVAVLVADLTDRRTGLLVSALWSVQPWSFVLSVPYSEGLFTAAAATCLLALHRGHWAVAGAAALVAGLVRPTGLALAVACLVAAVPALRAGHRRALAAPLIAPWGALGYLAWVGDRMGRPDAWFAAQEGGWGMRFDGGRSTLADAVARLVSPTVNPPSTAVTCYVLLASILVVVYVARGRWTPPVLTYVLLVVALSYGSSNGLVHIPRFLIPAFPLLIPLAVVLLRLPRRLLTALLLTAAALTSVGGALWLTHLPYAP